MVRTALYSGSSGGVATIEKPPIAVGVIGRDVSGVTVEADMSGSYAVEANYYIILAPYNLLLRIVLNLETSAERRT